VGGSEIFRTRLDWSWGPQTLLCNGNRFSFPGMKQPGCNVAFISHIHPAPKLKKE